MKAHTNEFKENIKLFGRELDSVITFGDTVLGNEELNAVTPIFQSSLLKSVMKQLEIDSNVEIPVGTLLNYKFGVKVKEDVVTNYRDNYDYVDFGNYIVYEVEKQEDTNSYSITCFDKMLYSMIEYTGLSITYPITIRDYIKTICNGIGLEFANENDTFPNHDKLIEKELFLAEDGNSLGYTYRDIFDQLAQVTASIICLNSNNAVEIRFPNETGDTIDEEYLKNVNVKFGEKYGPINTIVLSRAGESDNIYLDDPKSVELNGRCELKIIENQIMNFNNRNEFIPDILEKLNGLEFYLNDFSSTGIVYYDIYDKYNIQIGDMTYPCIMFNDEILITQGLEEIIFTNLPEGSTTDYTKADKTDRKINQTYIIVDKQNGEIESLSSSVTTISTTTGNQYQDLLKKFDGYTPQSDFATLENSVKQIQTDTYTKTEINTKLTDGSVTKVLTTSGTFDENGMHYEKTGAKTSSTINEKGVEVDNATTGEELLFAGYDEEINQTIVRTENLTVRKYLVIGENSRIEDYGDGGGVFIL